MSQLMRAGRAAGRVTGRAGGAAWQWIKAVSRGNAARVARRAGRWLLVRCWASALVRPGRWAWAATAVGAVLAAGTGFPWLILSGLIPLLAFPAKMICGLRPRVIILSDVSSRVKTLQLAQRVRECWEPEMRRLGLTQERERRGQTITVVPKLDRLKLGPYGVSGKVNLHPMRLVVSDLDGHRDRLESAFLAQCTITRRGYATAVVEFRHTDPLSRPVPADALPAPKRRLHVVTRIAEDGTGVEQEVILPRLVIGGAGSGKSTELTTFMWALHQAGIPIRLRIFDPKGGMELGWLRDAAHVYEVRPSRWAEFIGDAVEALQYRQRSLAKRGWQKLARFTEGEPLDVLVVDELLAVISQRRERVRIRNGAELSAGDAFDLYLSQGRAAGYTAVALTQLGQKELLGHARGLFPHITVLRLPSTEKEIVDRLIGAEHPAHLITPGQPGVGYTRTPDGRVVRSRGAVLTAAQRAELVAGLTAAKQRREEAKQRRREKAQTA